MCWCCCRGGEEEEDACLELEWEEDEGAANGIGDKPKSDTNMGGDGAIKKAAEGDCCTGESRDMEDPAPAISMGGTVADAELCCCADDDDVDDDGDAGRGRAMVLGVDEDGVGTSASASTASESDCTHSDGWAGVEISSMVTGSGCTSWSLETISAIASPAASGSIAPCSTVAASISGETMDGWMDGTKR